MATLRETIPLQKSKIVKKSIGGVLTLLVLVGFLSIFIVVLFNTEPDKLPPIMRLIRSILLVALPVVIGLLLCSVPVYQYYYWKRYFYDVDERNIVIRKGVIAQKEITLPFNRVTDVYVDQDLFDAIFGLYDVHISTPTEESGQFAHIDGVDKEGSRQLRQMILERINREDNKPFVENT